MTLRQCLATVSAAWLGLLTAMPLAFAQEPAVSSDTAAPPATVQAIWKHQEIQFYFQSFTTFYSCHGLEGKLERIMGALGVHAKVRVRAADCPASVARMPRVFMKVASPVEATPDAYAERDKNKSVRELVDRVKGGKSTHPLDSLEEFPAQWRKVSLTRGRLALEPGDCDLIEELQRKVLPKLAVRITDNDLQCMPNQLTLGQPRLEVEALIEMPRPDSRGPDSRGPDSRGPDAKGRDATGPDAKERGANKPDVS